MEFPKGDSCEPGCSSRSSMASPSPSPLHLREEPTTSHTLRASPSGEEKNPGSDSAVSGVDEAPRWQGASPPRSFSSSNSLTVQEQPASPSHGCASFSIKTEEGPAASVCGGDDSAEEQPVRRRRSFYFLFVLLGLTSLLGWNFVIQTLPFILTQKLRMRHLNNLFLGVYQVANIAMQLLLLAIPGCRPLLSVAASVGSGALGLVVALCVSLAPSISFVGVSREEEQEFVFGGTQRLLLGGLLVLDILMGCCQGLIQGVGYTVASSVAPGYVSAVSVGQGLAGLLVFSISTVTCFFLFDVETPRGLTEFCLLSFAFTACVAFAFASFLYAKLHSAELASKLALACPAGEERDVAEGEDPTNGLRSERRVGSIGFKVWGCEKKKRRNSTSAQCRLASAKAASGSRRRPLWLSVLAAGWRELLLAVFHFAYTYHLYPNMGPLGWKYNWEFPNQVVVMYGAWFFFETLGRAAPDLTWLPCFRWLRLSRGRYAFVSLGSLIFLAPFLAGYLMEPKQSFLTNPVWYLAVLSAFAFCHGWIGTLAFFFACNAVEDPREKRVSGPLTVLAVGVGCVVGFLSALAY